MLYRKARWYHRTVFYRNVKDRRSKVGERERKRREMFLRCCTSGRNSCGLAAAAFLRFDTFELPQPTAKRDPPLQPIARSDWSGGDHFSIMIRHHVGRKNVSLFGVPILQYSVPVRHKVAMAWNLQGKQNFFFNFFMYSTVGLCQNKKK